MFYNFKKENKQNKTKVQERPKFKLDIPGNTIVCDGKTIWAHNKDANEVNPLKKLYANNEDQF